MKLLSNRNTLQQEKFQKLLVLSGFLLILPLTLILGSTYGSPAKLLAIITLPLLSFAILNFNFSYSLLIALLFVNIRIGGIAIAAIFTIPLLFSFFINFNELRVKDFYSPILPFFIFFFLCCIPSFVSTTVFPKVIYESLNLVPFLILILITVAALKTHDQIRNFLNVFILIAFINSIQVIIEAVLSNNRIFGFAGVMFVDYVGIAIVLVFIRLFLDRSNKRLLYIPLLIVLILASIFTQTRNSWISIALIIATVVIFFYFRAERYNQSKRLLVGLSILMILTIGGIYSTLRIITPSVSERAEQFSGKPEEIVTDEGTVTNSLVSRLFIWDTALNTFRNNPITGVGLYGFPFVSYKYYTIPRLFFSNYVEGRTPHIGYLAIAVEAGIIGLFGFLIFVFVAVKFSFEALKTAENQTEKMVSVSLFFGMAYIVVSMSMTDAWLWDQGIVLWGILLSLNMVNRELLLID